jgi:uncharacterized protein with HEPN domain
MERDPRSFLWDVQEAADAIVRFTASMDSGGYAENEVVRAAVERKFEIIGEALSQLAKRDPGLARRVPDFRDIIAFRNLLIHGYAVVNQDEVWDVVQTSLPKLREAVAAQLNELGAAGGLQ